jgi:heterodisulfide reductase subunit A2
MNTEFMEDKLAGIKLSSADYDVLVIGGGIAGEETALKLADVGYKILIVEKDLTIGGRMILLSKVFPTLDCSACITTPKVSETARHRNITVLTKTEVKSVSRRKDSSFDVTLLKRTRYVIEHLCTGCKECEDVCPIVVADEYQYNQVGRKAVFIPFSIAQPKIANIDIGNCILCGLCEKNCPADAIDFTMVDIEEHLAVKSLVLATGFRLFDPSILNRYGYGRIKNVMTAMEMERQLAPTRPYNAVLRPKDGKMPDNIAYILCVGSRDQTVGNPICSQICCMYSTKQAQLLLGALPMADVTVYYLHVRAFGKGFCEFYNQALSMGVNYIKAKVASIKEKDNGNLVLRYEDLSTGKVKEKEHDLVVLANGILSDPEIRSVFTNEKLELDPYEFVKQTDMLVNPALTSIIGVYAAGTVTGPMDIPDTILSAGAAAAEVTAYLNGML